MIANRISIIGSINKETPACVIIEIAESMKFKVDRRLISDEYINKLLNDIRTDINNPLMMTDIYLDDEDLPCESDDNLRNVARLLNSDPHQWCLDTLNEAFEHIRDYGFGDKQILTVDDLEDFGRKNPSKPLAMDACMLHKHCKLHGIKCHRWQSEEDMYLKLKYSLMDKNELIELLCKEVKFRRDWRRDMASVKECEYEVFGSDDRILKAFAPRDYKEAVVLAVKRFGMDISYANNPIVVYKELVKMEVSIDDSDPLDDNLLELALEASEDDNIINLWRRDKTWLFTDIINSDMSTEFTIYAGVHPLVPFTIETTYISKDPIQFCSEKLFTIGNLSDTSSLYVVSMTELSTNFKIRGCFMIPHTPDVLFSESAIAKIRSYEVFDESIEEIDRISEFTQETVKLIKCSPQKDIIYDFISSIKDLGFILRGWDGSGEYPLKSQDTLTEDFGDVEIKYTIQKDKLRGIFLSLSDCDQTIVENLPLLTRMCGKFVRVTSDDVGTTIKEKLKIMEDDQDDNSCIRLSSNYLLESCWYFIKECFDEVPFDIDTMGWIS